jgi:hypothetical protein
MKGYWSSRRRHALANSRERSQPELREIYLRVAEHYRSLEQLCSTVPAISSEFVRRDDHDHA